MEEIGLVRGARVCGHMCIWALLWESVRTSAIVLEYAVKHLRFARRKREESERRGRRGRGKREERKR